MSVNIKTISEALGIPNFNRTDLLDIALTHRSYTNEHHNLIQLPPTQHEIEYRRLALLGDAILGAIVTDYLYHRCPTLDKGALSSLKSHKLVTRVKLSEFARELNLKQLCLLGQGEKLRDESCQVELFGEMFEALFGAIYLEFNRDFSRSRNWLVEHFIAKAVNDLLKNASSDLWRDIWDAEDLALPNVEERRLSLLGNDLLGAVVIDYLYHLPEPRRDEGKLTQWKSQLVIRERFTKTFKALLGRRYLAMNRDFSDTRDWIESLIVEDVNKLLADERLSAQADFTASGFIDAPREEALPKLVSHITDKNWREIFLQVVGMMKPTDELLLLMKRQIDALVVEDETLQQLLVWVNQKSLSAKIPYKLAEVRAFYLALVSVLGKAFVRTLHPNLHLNGAKARNFVRHFERARSLVDNPNVTIALNFSLGDDPAGILACVFGLNLEPQLKQALEQFQTQLPSPKNDLESFEKWRQANGQAWIVKLTAIIGHNLYLGEQEKELLKRYYYANQLLVECLTTESCEVTSTVREKIEDTLLLPTAGIERRKK